MKVNTYFFSPKTGLHKTGLLAFAFFLFTISMSWANTYTVNNTDDNGPGSLRQAITEANDNPGADVINFSVAGTLVLFSNLPNITDALTIDSVE